MSCQHSVGELGLADLCLKATKQKTINPYATTVVIFVTPRVTNLLLHNVGSLLRQVRHKSAIALVNR
jgi:hypothetical protein